VNVLVAMSGGVDSSVAASLLLDQGHEVTGVTLRLWGGESDSGCCSVGDVEDARQVAATLGIDHHVFNMTEEFEEHVVGPYVAAHAAGRTPNPCIECNRHLKFSELLAAADRLGFDRLATGHHARIVREEGSASLRRGVDAAKDQSYVLSMLTPTQLDRLLFPVGELTKSQVRQEAAARRLGTAAKPESQDTCFVSSTIGRRGFLAGRTTLRPGVLVERDGGAVVGDVAEVELVTVGQRKGLGVDAAGRRRVAVAVDPGQGRVLVASPEDSQIDAVRFAQASVTWTGAPLLPGEPVLVQVRSHGAAMPGRLEDGSVRLERATDPVAAGQTMAFFDVARPDLVRGSAVIA
jgi:tRNA-specific 2-thiouridylase